MKIDWNRWRRRHRSLTVERLPSAPFPHPRNPTVVALVSRTRPGVWRAMMQPGRQVSPNFNRMEDALLWAQERLPMYEIAGLE